MTTWLPHTTRHEIKRIEHGPLPLAAIRFVTIHINDGTTAGTLDWWAQDGHEADGAHLQISDNGHAFQCAPLNVKCWHDGNYNDVSWGLEHEGIAPRRASDWPHVQLHASANRCAWLLHEANLGRPQHGVNIKGHGELGVQGGGHPLCPGVAFPWSTYLSLVHIAYMEHWGR